MTCAASSKWGSVGTLQSSPHPMSLPPMTTCMAFWRKPGSFPRQTYLWCTHRMQSKQCACFAELHGTCCSVIVLFLLVCFAVGLQVCFSISLFEVLPHFFNISGDTARAHMGTHCWEVKIDWEMRASPKHQIMW